MICFLKQSNVYFKRQQIRMEVILMFSSISMKNFRCYRDGFVDLRTGRGDIKQSIVVFGDSGSGRTSFVEVFSFLKETCDSLEISYLHTHRSETRYDHSTIKPSTFIELASKNRSYTSKGNMEVIYEFRLKEKTFIYEIIVNDKHRIVSETLIQKNNSVTILFLATQDEYYLGKGVISPRQRSIVDRTYNEYFGSHSFLSIINFVVNRKGVSVKRSLNHVMKFISKLYIVHDNYLHEERHNFINDIWIYPYRGIVDLKGSLIMKGINKVVNELMCTLFPQIEYVEYEFTKQNRREYLYDTKVYLKNNSGVGLVYEQLSRSMRKALRLMSSILDRYFGHTIIIDNVSDGWTGSTTEQYYLQGFIGDSQQIFTSSSNDIMNSIDSKSVYFSIIDEVSHSIQCIDELSDVRTAHNIRARYESGVYDTTLEGRKPEYYRYEQEFKELISDAEEAMEEHNEMKRNDSN